MDKSDVPAHVAALKRAIVVATSQAALADGLAKFLNRPTLGQQTVSKWLKKKTLIEAEYWPAFEQVTGGQVTREQLRPDVFARDQLHSSVPAIPVTDHAA